MSQYFEIAATFLGIIQGILIMMNKNYNWIFYCMQMLSLLVFSYLEKLYGDMINNFIFLIVGMIAFFIWNRGKTKHISVSGIKTTLVYIFITMISIYIIFILLDKTADPLPLLDAASTSTAFLATILMALRRVDCWIVWVVNDLLYCAEYYMLPHQAFYLFALNVLWTLMAIVSYLQWKQFLWEKREFKNLKCK